MTSTPSLDLLPLAAYLDEFLHRQDIPDEANAVNGLQVENQGQVGSVIAAVDASQATIDGAVAQTLARPGPPPLLLVHHGLFWDGNVPVTGRRYRRLWALLEHDIALYAAHIPLDVHPEVGNNAVLSQALGLEDPEPFGSYKGIALGVAGRLKQERDALVTRLEEVLHTRCHLIPGGPELTGLVGVITGAAGGEVQAAREAGCDTFITGEGAHHTYFDAMELGVNLIFAGHYATEQVGVKALAAHLERRFGLPWTFHDHPTGL